MYLSMSKHLSLKVVVWHSMAQRGGLNLRNRMLKKMTQVGHLTLVVTVRQPLTVGLVAVSVNRSWRFLNRTSWVRVPPGVLFTTCFQFESCDHSNADCSRRNSEFFCRCHPKCHQTDSRRSTFARWMVGGGPVFPQDGRPLCPSPSRRRIASSYRSIRDASASAEPPAFQVVEAEAEKPEPTPQKSPRHRF